MGLDLSWHRLLLHAASPYLAVSLQKAGLLLTMRLSSLGSCPSCPSKASFCHNPFFLKPPSAGSSPWKQQGLSLVPLLPLVPQLALHGPKSRRNSLARVSAGGAAPRPRTCNTSRASSASTTSALLPLAPFAFEAAGILGGW